MRSGLHEEWGPRFYRTMGLGMSPSRPSLARLAIIKGDGRYAEFYGSRWSQAGSRHWENREDK